MTRWIGVRPRVDVLAHGMQLVLQQLELGADVDLAVLTETLELLDLALELLEGLLEVQRIRGRGHGQLCLA